MNNFLLQYQNNRTNILSHDILFIDNIKPNFSFNYDELICESSTNLYFYILDDKQINLDEKQIEEVSTFCENYYLNGDYNVYTYDPSDDNLFKGILSKSEAERLGYKYVINIGPESSAAKYDENTNSWINYYAAFTDNGSLAINVSSANCLKCVQFLTKEEYDNLPEREHPTDSWDFVTESWVDKRDLEKLKIDTIAETRNRYEQVRWYKLKKYIPQYEQDTWRIQLDEALKYTSDKSSNTPYIDTFLEYREDENKPTKEELVQDIISNNEIYIKEIAKINAEQWTYMKNIESAETGYDVDSIRRKMLDYTSEVLGLI